MSTLSLFNFNGHDVRVVMIDGGPWWVAADVCRALDLSTGAGTTHQLQHLVPSEVMLVSKATLGPTEVSFPNRGASCVSESGLYRLDMRSDKPEARAFQNWVTRVVLPAIRKDGAYIMGKEKVATVTAARRIPIIEVALDIKSWEQVAPHWDRAEWRRLYSPSILLSSFIFKGL
ncbi:Bro-N domain-containing protein [Xanthobacter sp.]|uniref:BRO-N domain-containing protein n=1 Tax=Xanthobacter sp. TaxID=35809 RepID=UPI0035B12433